MSGLHNKTSSQLRKLADRAWDFCATEMDLTGFDQPHEGSSRSSVGSAWRFRNGESLLRGEFSLALITIERP
jgi:hypothetical protein